MRILAAAVTLGLLLGCGQVYDRCDGVMCGACAPALSVKVVKAGGGPVDGVTLSGINGSCSAQTDATYCMVDANSPGTYEFDVAAPGFQSHHVKETVAEAPSTGCCSCGYDPRTVDVTLAAE